MLQTGVSEAASSEDAKASSGHLRSTALECLVAVAAYHGVSTSPEQLIHEHALSAGEPSLARVAALAGTLGLRARSLRLEWDEVVGMGRVFPAIARLNNGNYVVIAGLRQEDGGVQVGVLDPLSSQPGVLAVSQQQFIAQWSGELMLATRRFALDDPNQPFGLRWFIPELLRHKTLLRDIALAAIMLHLLGLLMPLFFQLVIDKVLVHQSYSTLYVLSFGVVLAIVFEAGFGFLRQFLLLNVTNKVDIRVSTRTFRHLLRLPLSFFEATTAGVTVRHLQQAEKIRQFLTGRLFTTAIDTSALLILVPVLFFYSVKLTLIVLLFTGMIGAIVVALLGPFRRRLEQLYNAEAQRQAMLVEAINGIRTIKSLAVEPVQRKRWDDRAAAAVDMHYAVGKISASAGTVTNGLEKLMMVVIIVVGAGAVFDQELTFGALIAFQMLAGRVVTPLVQMVTLAQEYQETALSVRMLSEVMNHPPERGRAVSGQRPTLEGRIQFEDVSFRYLPASPPSIDRVSLEIAPGEMIGVVGRSGSGKSTLTKLIQGLYQPQEGIIRLDKTDIRDIELAHLRQKIGVVLQDNFLFRGSVRENIAMTRPNASADEVAAVCHLAGATEFIERLPQGFETLIEEGGANLSGGQKQRLAIARALLADPPILIFDEATSALDPESESVVMENLARIAAGRTVVLVSHRLSTLVPCDRILVMDRGRVVACGRHAELLNGCDLYRHLWQKQSRA